MTGTPKSPFLVAAMLAALLFQACGNTQEPTKAEAVEARKDDKPRIVAVKRTFNFGKVREGDRVQHIFKIVNQGDADLAIHSARGS